MDDCKHEKIKCMSCHRWLDAVPDKVPTTSRELPRDENGYLPATCEHGDIPIGEYFTIKKGPLVLEIRFTPDGCAVAAWDTTDENCAMDAIQVMYSECLNPYAPNLVGNSKQGALKFKDDWHERHPPPLTDEELFFYEYFINGTT